MIIIFNIKGAVVALLGLLAGVVLTMLTRSLTLGVFAVVSVWCIYGRAGIDKETGVKKVAGSFFFIPVFFWGIVLGLIGIPLGILVDFAAIRADSSPSYTQSDKGEVSESSSFRRQFNLDEKGLATNESDDLEISSGVTELISAALPDSEKNIRVKSTADSVLILIQIPDLKRINQEDRTLLLYLVKSLAEGLRPRVKVYAGLKGNLVFGAILVPGSSVKTGKVVNEKPLYAFYASPVNLPADNTLEAGNSADPLQLETNQSTDSVNGLSEKQTPNSFNESGF